MLEELDVAIVFILSLAREPEHESRPERKNTVAIIEIYLGSVFLSKTCYAYDMIKGLEKTSSQSLLDAPMSTSPDTAP